MKKIFCILAVATCLPIFLSAQRPKSLGSDSIDVTHYQINLSITDFTSKIISGNTSIKAIAKVNGLKHIPLDLLKLTVDSVKLENTITTDYTYNDTLLKITSASSYNLGDTIKIIIYYHGIPQTDASAFGGFYFSGDYAYNLGVAFDANPHNYGRVWFPCIDDFVDKAFYQFNITTENSKMAVCNGHLTGQTDNTNGTKTWHWTLGQIMPTYLASVAVAPYVRVADTVAALLGNIPIAIYVKQADSTKAVNSFVNLKTIIQGYESHFGPYRWDRVGYVAVPFTGGAMEHATSIAYPAVCVNGNTTYDFLYAHELSHHWFGDLVTCSSAGDMWINEGWAVFAEFIFKEIISGESAATVYMKGKLFSVLKSAHIDDGGFYAVCGVPHQITYGTTVYDKGGLVVNTLRHYMGDSLFFATVRQYTDFFKFQNISCEGLRDYFSMTSGINLTDFFDNWVFEPGFPHYDVDSMKVSGNSPVFNVDVYMRQKYYGRTQLFNSNRIELEFLNNNFSSTRRTVQFDGQTAVCHVTLPFYPSLVFVDPDQKTADAVTSDRRVYKTTAAVALAQEYATITPVDVADSMLLHVEHHWVAPDAVKNNSSIYRLSPNRYWRISGIIPANNSFKARFDFNRTNSTSSGYIDTHFLPSATSVDSLILVFRENPSADWRIIPFVRTGNTLSGKLEVSHALPGEYALAIGEPNQSGINDQSLTLHYLQVFPNPSAGTFEISNESENGKWIRVSDVTGKVIDLFPLNYKETKIWQPRHSQSAVYIIELLDEKKNTLATQRIVKQQ